MYKSIYLLAYRSCVRLTHIHSFMHSHILSFIHWLTPLTHSSTDSFTHCRYISHAKLTHIQSFVCSFIRSLIRPFTHSFIYSFIHSRTSLQTHRLQVAMTHGRCNVICDGSWESSVRWSRRTIHTTSRLLLNSRYVVHTFDSTVYPCISPTLSSGV